MGVLVARPSAPLVASGDCYEANAAAVCSSSASVQSVDDPNDVAVWNDFAKPHEARAFVSSEALRNVMQCTDAQSETESGSSDSPRGLTYRAREPPTPRRPLGVFRSFSNAGARCSANVVSARIPPSFASEACFTCYNLVSPLRSI